MDDEEPRGWRFKHAVALLKSADFWTSIGGAPRQVERLERAALSALAADNGSIRRPPPGWWAP